MRIQKIAFTLLVAFTLGSTLNASADPLKKDWQEQIVSYLYNLDLNYYNSVDKVLIDFMINDQKEIIVLSTNVEEMDNYFKSRLNYKKIDNENLEALVKYTLPIRFEKK